MGDWSDADIATVKTMWKDGSTATVIAAALGGGVTRGAVLGKIHRLGLKRAEEGPTGARPPGVKPAAARPQGAPKPVLRVANASSEEPARQAAGSAGPQPIWALGQCQCRWPMGNLLDPPGLFCGDATVDGSSWCPVHEELVYAGANRPRPDALPAREPPRLAAAGGRSRF